MIFESVEFDDHEQVVFARDAASGLSAIIAIHSTALGAAAGGCRILPYKDDQAALTDVLRLSRAMTLKNAMAGLPLGGGKSVIIADPAREKTPALLRAMGEAIDRLGGRYITAEDVGTSAADMVEIRKGTRYVMGLPVSAGGSGDPSPSTALGCFEGIRAAVAYKLGRSSLEGVHIAVQGLGNVGLNLARLLAEAGAKLTVSDVRPAVVAQAVRAFGARAVDAGAITGVDADVFAPCALGAVLSDETLPRLKVAVVAGAANNQLATPAHGAALRDRGILYAPDYVINAGGIIRVGAEITGATRGDVEARVRGIGNTLLNVFRTADAEGIATSDAADRMALARIALAPKAGAVAA
jgi:leucine dehydrogenase